MRRFHNSVKQAALARALRECGATHVLDVGCGPASDANKYARLGVPFVRGVDVDPAAIQEGNRRLRSISGSTFSLACYDDVTTREVLAEKAPPEGWHLVVFNFSVQYLMRDLVDFRAFCERLFAVTRPGARIIGTSLDARLLRKYADGRSAVDDDVVAFEFLPDNELRFQIKQSTRYYAEGAIVEPQFQAFSLIYCMHAAGFHIASLESFVQDPHTPEEKLSACYVRWAFEK